MSQFHYKSLSLAEPDIELTVHIPGDVDHSPTLEDSSSPRFQPTIADSQTIVSSSQQNLTKRSSFRENGDIQEQIDLAERPPEHEQKTETTLAVSEGAPKEPHPWSWSYIIGRLKAHMRPHRKVGDTPSVWSSIKAIILTSCTIPRCNEHARSRSMMIFDHI